MVPKEEPKEEIMEPNDLQDQNIVELLAVRGMYFRRVEVDGEVIFENYTGLQLPDDWNPLVDLNAIHEIESRLSDEQWVTYMRVLYQEMARTLAVIDGHRANKFLRHADPRTCALALAEVLS